MELGTPLEESGKGRKWGKSTSKASSGKSPKTRLQEKSLRGGQQNTDGDGEKGQP